MEGEKYATNADRKLRSVLSSPLLPFVSGFHEKVFWRQSFIRLCGMSFEQLPEPLLLLL